MAYHRSSRLRFGVTWGGGILLMDRRGVPPRFYKSTPLAVLEGLRIVHMGVPAVGTLSPEVTTATAIIGKSEKNSKKKLH